MLGSWPIATNIAAAGMSSSSPVTVSRTRTASTLSAPTTSSTTAFQRTWIFSLASARSIMIRDARNSSRRCTIVTDDAIRARKLASSIAESPPPTTTMGLSRKKKPSQVAHVETPKPRRRPSLGRSSHRAEAPVEMITLFARC